MNLREYLRNDFQDYIRNRIVKDKCEFCGSTENLHLHHIDRFHNLLMETLDELKFQELDTDEYDEMELKSIRNFMLAKQIKCEYITLCKSCHMKLHTKEKYTDEYSEHYYNPYGGYVLINNKELIKLNIEPNLLFRFIFLSTNINYDGYIVDINKNKNNKFNSSNLNELLNLGNTEYYSTIKALMKLNLLVPDDKGIKINKNFIARGFTNFKQIAIVFNKNYIKLYNSVKITEHNHYGKVFKIYMKSKHGMISNFVNEAISEDFCDKTNVSRFIKKSNKNILLLKKKTSKDYIINPALWYDGSLSNEFQCRIDDFNR